MEIKSSDDIVFVIESYDHFCKRTKTKIGDTASGYVKRVYYWGVCCVISYGENNCITTMIHFESIISVNGKPYSKE